MTTGVPEIPLRRGPGRPRGGDADRTRAAALEVAVELFAGSGFRGTSLNKVAQQAGLSQAGLLHHFPSKQNLLTEVLRRRDEMDRRDLVASARHPVGWAAFELLVDLVSLNTGRRALVHLYSTLAGEATDQGHPAHAWLQDHLTAAISSLSTALRAGQDAGTVRAEAPAAKIAQLTVAVLDGLQLQWLALPADAGGGDPVDMVADLREWVDTLRSRWEIRLS